jgi:acyl carrier protein
MNHDPLYSLLVEFFELPPETKPEAINQQSIRRWDSLAMVQLITELQHVFSVEFELHELEHLRSYQEIRQALERRGALPSRRSSP